jgi:hypothetical protein
MMLVGAVAVAWRLEIWIADMTSGAVSWSSVRYEVGELFGPSGNEQTVYRVISIGSGLSDLIAPFAAMATVAMIPIQLTGLRTSLRRMANQPGMAAVFSGSITFAAIVAYVLIAIWRNGQSAAFTQVSVEHLMLLSPVLIGWSILVSWMTLLLGNRWHPNTSWVDRLGRGLGAFWLAAGILTVGLIIGP